ISFVKVSNSRIRVLALKKAELSDEIILRMVELDGKPQRQVRIQFAAPLTAAREVNGQEQPVGAAKIDAGALLTSFSAYQPRTFALRLAVSQTKVAPSRSQPVPLHYDLATASEVGTKSNNGFDGEGDTLPAEMLPRNIIYNGVKFQLGPSNNGSSNALLAKGQTIDIPAGRFNRVYLLAASANGDQTVTFEIGSKKEELNIQNWRGFIGQWDDREWSSKDTSHDDYGQMLGLKPGYIKRANLAWYSDHYHNPRGENVPYRYSYLFAYSSDVPPGAKTLTLPNNDSIRIFAISVADENPNLTPAQPLYDMLPAKAKLQNK
ncbi:MAG: glycosyl hydrolase-related protein, partial [Candidatus Sulfotelmatobacter sp.]